ncbi:MAG: hypothetical protein JO244_06680, partial [Solirubrobacterales bacterium]|nr:hypothetical protein [Solirubrobacterales bacterium]
MASLENLPPDQRAVLELVLRRGRSYDQIAEALSIDRTGVRQRALAALDALGPATRVPAERRALITDYLLGALPPAVAEEVRQHLGQSASERAWARAVSSELQPLAERPLPEVPADTGTRVRAEAPALTSGAAPAAADAEVAPAAGTRSSRRGGALLLGASAVLVVAVVLVLLLTGGGSKPKKHPTQTVAATGTTSTTGPTGTTGARIVAQINLKPPSGSSSSALGLAEVLQAQGQLGVA